MTELLVENIIAKTQFQQYLDLPELAASIPNCTYDKNEQPVLIVNFHTPKRAIFILPNGQLFCTGITSLDEAKETLTQFLGILELKGILFEMLPPLTIHMMTVSTILEQPLHLQLVKEALQDETVFYNPDQAPWLEYHLLNEITMLIFPSGKTIITGASSLIDTKDALNRLKEKLTSKGVLKILEGKHA